jgi:aspartyl-tRNA(Asn)/glutamyl-tRNA(Gln) amidotransferase subunit C
MEYRHPMSLHRTDIEKIAHLARLAVAEEDIPRYARELSNILQMVEQMNSVDTRAVVPMAHPLEAGQRLRADEITETDQREQFQSIAPQVEAGLYLVPKVIE